jgi:hypothetical protein
MPIIGNSSSGGKKPTAPTIGSASSGNAQAAVNFTASSYIGKGTISYTATSSPGSITGTGSSSPISVTGLSNGTAYTFTVFGTTNYGVVSNTTSASNSVTPIDPPVVTGGTLSSDATYYYRTFTANGSLVVTNGSVVADYALIGGGGAGNWSFFSNFDNGTGYGQAFQGGNGGAGGYRNANAQTLSGTYNITIGGGGSAPVQGGSGPGSGNPTTGFSLSATGGGHGGDKAGGNGGGGGSGGGAGGQWNNQYGPGDSGSATGSGGIGSQGGNGTGGYPGAGGGSGTTPGTAGNSGVNIFSMGTTYGIGGGNRGGNTGDGGAGGSITTARYSGSNAGDGFAGSSGIVIVRYTRASVGG